MLLTENRLPGVVPAKARYMTKIDPVRISQYFQIPLRIPAVSVCIQGKGGCVLVFQPDPHEDPVPVDGFHSTFSLGNWRTLHHLAVCLLVNIHIT